MVTLNLRDDCNGRVATNFKRGMTDKRFLELEITAWLTSPERKKQLEGEAYYDGYQDVTHRERLALDEDGKPIARGEYDLVYPQSAKNVGKYTVTIKFKNHYAGTEKRTFTIKPKGTSVSKVTSPKKAQLKVTWKKQATQTTGYQVQYSTDKNFKKGNKTVTVKGAKTTAKTISKLTKGKKYYVRVRTYKTVNKTNFYSGWSKSSSVTVKK